MNKVFSILSSALMAVAMSFAVQSANQVCALFIHQPEVPEEVMSLRKF